MKNDLTLELLIQARETMRMSFGKRENCMPEAINAITASSDFFFLQLYDKYLDLDEYLIDFIRFANHFTSNPEKISELFSIFIYNIKKISVLLQDPAFQFMANPCKETLLHGLFKQPFYQERER